MTICINMTLNERDLLKLIYKVIKKKIFRILYSYLARYKLKRKRGKLMTQENLNQKEENSEKTTRRPRTNNRTSRKNNTTKIKSEKREVQGENKTIESNGQKEKKAINKNERESERQETVERNNRRGTRRTTTRENEKKSKEKYSIDKLFNNKKNEQDYERYPHKRYFVGSGQKSPCAQRLPYGCYDEMRRHKGKNHFAEVQRPALHA